MSLAAQAKGFLRAFRSPKKSSFRHSGHALARTLRDATQTGSAGKSTLGAGSEAVNKIAAESADRYDQSFDD